ncbi:wobble nucleotide-excising tRNase [Acholeplasma morum]|uniref:AAA family ATPase n=1 Tax=Paracholeplasma morum TaxID=264637 RepID=UPI0019583E1B|nr:AAA family ATPase [Paracholeplasma morum]MBM7453046.1 wobble nucleotide-excising tRNase [Paracholeplasma morum]
MIINEIRKVGCIDAITSQVNLSKNAFIYGLNGSGKTTIKSIIKSSFLEGSKLEPSFGSKPKDSEAKLTIFNETVEFRSGKLIKPFSNKIKLYVFDTDYIENNIYINGEISDNHKHEYFKMFVGDNVSSKIQNLLEKYTEYSNKSKEHTELITKLEFDFQALENFNNNIDESVTLLRMGYDQKYLLEEVVRKRILSNVKEINETTIEWLQKGNKIRKNDELCPYCGQYTNDEIEKNLIGMYNEITAELNHLNEETKKQIDNLYANIASFDTKKIYALIEMDLTTLKNEVLQKLISKKTDLSKKIELSSASEKNNLKERLRYFKPYIEELRSISEELKFDDIFSIPDDKIEHSKITNINNRTDNLVKDESLQKELKSLNSDVYKKAKTIQSKMNDIKLKQEAELGTHIDKINKKLREYNVKYQVTFEKYKQKTNTKQNQAQLELELVPISSPTIKKKFNKDTLKRVLSEGEKAMLAWIFFIVDLENKLTGGRNVIIIDDPISSYDSYRRFNLVNDLRKVISIQVDKELLILSHEKSFTNAVAFLPKTKHFNLIDGQIKNIDLKEIIESDLKFDIEFIKENSDKITQDNILEFVIRSRNFLEYIRMLNTFAKGKFFRITEYNLYFSEASKLIHFKTNFISEGYFKYVEKKYRQLTNQSITFDLSKIDITNINFDLITNGSIDNIYNARLKIDKYLFKVLNDNSFVDFNGKETTHDLLRYARKFIPIVLSEGLELHIPIINTYNHPNQNFGLRRVDCSEISKQNLYDFVNSL